MPSANRYYLTGFYISFFLYALVFGSLVYTFGSSSILVQRYTSKKNFLDIIIVEKKQEYTNPAKSTADSSYPSESSKASVKTQTMGVQDLFKTIDTKEITNKGSKQSSAPSRLAGKGEAKADNASKILEKLEFKQTNALVTSSSSAIYDEFKGKINDILQEEWITLQLDMDGAQGKVLVEIDNAGRFSYSIVRLSYNVEFNQIFEKFLKKMSAKVFPKYNGSGVFSAEITFNGYEESRL